MTQKYKTTIPVTEDELRDLTIVKANLEQILQKPLTIRATFSLILRYIKERIDKKEFKEKILQMEITRKEDNQEKVKEIGGIEKEKKEIKEEKQEKGGFLFSIFKRK